jgi:YesN/AraC family two-component response regulator
MSIVKKGSNILVIEDNQGDFAMVEEFLLEQVESVTIVHTESFKKSKEILSRDKDQFDIVLLDLSLPDKAGLPLITEIIEMCPRIPVIVLTGYADFDFGVKSLSLGISDYILKDELTSISLYKSIVYSSERKKAISSLENYIKAIEAQNEKLREISWVQSHVVRAPLARMMGLIDLLKNTKTDDEEKQMMMEYLLLSANELDKVIMNITDLSGITEIE